MARLWLGGIHRHAKARHPVSQFHAKAVELTLILPLPIIKTVHRLTDAPKHSAYLLSVVERIAYSQHNQITSGLEWAYAPDVNYVFALRPTPNEQTIIVGTGYGSTSLPNHVLDGVSPDG